MFREAKGGALVVVGCVGGLLGTQAAFGGSGAVDCLVKHQTAGRSLLVKADWVVERNAFTRDPGSGGVRHLFFRNGVLDPNRNREFFMVTASDPGRHARDKLESSLRLAHGVMWIMLGVEPPDDLEDGVESLKLRTADDGVLWTRSSGLARGGGHEFDLSFDYVVEPPKKVQAKRAAEAPIKRVPFEVSSYLMGTQEAPIVVAYGRLGADQSSGEPNCSHNVVLDWIRSGKF